MGVIRTTLLGFDQSLLGLIRSIVRFVVNITEFQAILYCSRKQNMIPLLLRADHDLSSTLYRLLEVHQRK